MLVLYTSGSKRYPKVDANFAMSHSIPIEGAGASNFLDGLFGSASSSPSWREAQKAGDTETKEKKPIHISEFLREEHHNYYGRPWIVGRLYFDYLITRGIRKTDKLLDFGCGAGRVGIWFIPYLNESCYFGIDAHLRSLVAFAEYEVPLYRLAEKKPRLLFDDKFSFDHFGVKFDAMLDLSVSWGLPVAKAMLAYQKAHQSLNVGSRIFIPGEPRLSQKELQSIGFDVTNVEEVAYPIPLYEKSTKRIKRVDVWHELTKV